MILNVINVVTFLSRMAVFIGLLTALIFILIGVVQVVLKKNQGKTKIIRGLKIIAVIFLILLLAGSVERLSGGRICFGFTCPVLPVYY